MKKSAFVGSDEAAIKRNNELTSEGSGGVTRFPGAV